MIIVGVGHPNSLPQSVAVRLTSSGSFAAPLKATEEGAAALSEMIVMCER